MANGTSNALPNVVAVATATNYGRFVVGPLEAGIGTPLGNALRRILLSSLPGSAVTSVRIQNVYHEFSCVPSVREDVTEIVLNVKNIRLRSYSDRPVRLQLSKQGPGEVRAGDVELPANVELVNPEQLIATLDGDESHIEMELTVERGRGYVSFEAREGLPIGTIPVDAIFSPIPKVNYLVEPADLEVLSTPAEGEEEVRPLDPAEFEGSEQVVIEIWTDGTIDPGEALSLSAQYLSQHSSLIATFNRETAPAQNRDMASTLIPQLLFDMSIEDLNLSMRTFNCLKRSGITKVGQVLSKDRKELLGLRNFGEKSYDELYLSLKSRDLLVPGTPLANSASDAEGAGEEGEADEEGEPGEGDDVEYPAVGAGGDEPDVYMSMSEAGEDTQGTEIVDAAGVSEGSMAMAAGIYVADEPASEAMDLTGDTVPQANLPAEDGATGVDTDTEVENTGTAKKARSRKK